MHHYSKIYLHHLTCLFANVFAVQPIIETTVSAEIVNGTHYQSVSCSAISGRPEPLVSWLVNGLPASDFPFIVVVNNSLPSNETFTASSVLRFPTHLQDEDRMTCVVHHQTFPQAALTTVRVETYSKLVFAADPIGVVVFARRCC